MKALNDIDLATIHLVAAKFGLDGDHVVALLTMAAAKVHGTRTSPRRPQPRGRRSRLRLVINNIGGAR
jgi:hypothetical protein